MSSNTGTKLEVVKIDLLSDRNGVNKMGHNTSKYEYDELIVRRGQSFKIKVTFSRKFDQNSEIIVLEMNGNGKRYIIMEQSNVDDASWGFVVKKQNGDIVTLNVCTSADSPVGRFRFFVWTLSKTYSNVALSQYDPKNDIYVLFNPWSQADVVYMSGDEEKKEYVLNDGGCIFYGSQNRIMSRPWNYGQFEKPILDATLLLLQSTENRGDAINVVRSISALVNANDESGVLVGNWGSTFPGGISPMAWNGSVEILRKFYKTRNSVKYGQCWVFAGVVTTVLRSLGIPCRTISNFSSAHDTDKNVTIDIFMDESFNVLNSLSSDSIWNFHCWNEGWLERSDLGSKYGGWQVIDSTPQERSSGLFQCGPTSVAAIKNGEILHDYDGHFVFAEVNSDQVYWQKKTDGSVSKIYTDMTAVGKNISTKVMGSSSAREDITLQYKFPEGSDEERVVVQKATRIANPDRWFSSGRSDEFSFPVVASSRMSNISNVEVMYNPDRSADVSHRLARRNDDPTIMSPMASSIGPVAMFDSSRLSHFERHGIMANRAICAMSETPDQSTQLIIETNENTTVGKPLNAKVRVINDSSAIRTIKLKILGHVVTYTGNVVGKCYEKDVELKLQASQEQDVQIMVQPEEYLDLLVDNFSFRFTARAHTVETNSVAASIRTYGISSPELNITVPVNIKVHQKFQVEVGFTNPISRPLEGVILKAEGSGLETPETTKASIIGPNATVKLIIPDVEATRTGQLSLIISLDDPKLPEVHGQVKFEVQD